MNEEDVKLIKEKLFVIKKRNRAQYLLLNKLETKIFKIEARFPTSFPSTNKVRNAIKKLQDFDSQINIIIEDWKWLKNDD